MSSIEHRVNELEARSAEQQQTIDALSDMIAKQWRKIDEMTSLGQVLKGRVLSLEEKIPDEDVPPPHY